MTESGKCWELDVQMRTNGKEVKWNLNEDSSFVKEPHILEYVNGYDSWKIGEEIGEKIEDIDETTV